MVDLNVSSWLRRAGEDQDCWAGGGTRIYRRLNGGCPTGPNLHQAHLRVGSRCARGSYRKQNEDKCYADTVDGIFLVADGMGGHYGGADASRLVLETVPAAIRAETNSALRPTGLQMAVGRAIEAAQQAMVSFATEHPLFNRMGATLAVVKIEGHTAYFSRVGDCRVYLQRGDEIRQLTSDQTYVQAMVDAGALTPAEARTSCFRNIVTNSVCVRGIQEAPCVESIELRDGDRLLLATDGLTSVLDNDTIAKILAGPSPQEAADQLVLEALRRDSHDNVTCVVLKVVPEQVHFRN